MSKTEAHALLNAARSGAPVHESKIMAALKVTGDLDIAWMPAPDESVEPEPVEASA